MTWLRWIPTLIGLSALAVLSQPALNQSVPDTYTARTTLLTAPTETASKTAPSTLALELRLQLRERQGEIWVKAQTFPLTFAFPIVSERQSQNWRLEVKVTLCLEAPSVVLQAQPTADGRLVIAPSTQIVTCNFERLKVTLPQAISFVPKEISTISATRRF
jgi:hypothetical protein